MGILYYPMLDVLHMGGLS